MSEEMKAGRELDALVAERVFGCKVVWPPRADEPGITQAEFERRRRLSWVPNCGCADRAHIFVPDEGGYAGWLKDYSTAIADAWEVVDHLIAKGWEVSEAGYARTTRKWDFTFNNGGSSFQGDYCDTAPMAIVTAALKAVGACPPHEFGAGTLKCVKCAMQVHAK